MMQRARALVLAVAVLWLLGIAGKELGLPLLRSVSVPGYEALTGNRTEEVKRDVLANLLALYRLPEPTYLKRSREVIERVVAPDAVTEQLDDMRAVERLNRDHPKGIQQEYSLRVTEWEDVNVYGDRADVRFRGHQRFRDGRGWHSADVVWWGDLERHDGHWKIADERQDNLEIP